MLIYNSMAITLAVIGNVLALLHFWDNFTENYNLDYKKLILFNKMYPQLLLTG